MAFNLSAAIGGAAQRASEIMQEERQAAYDLVDKNVSEWMQLGIPVMKERKKLRMGMDRASKFLSNRGFTNDQIATALYQGRHEEVVKHIQNLELVSKDNPDLKYKPSEIISMGPNYQESGKTMDEILDGVMGKVSAGMTTSDALADLGGKGLQGAFMQSRADAAAAASGFDLGTLRAMATEDFEYGEAPEGGVITLVDPLASQQAKASMSSDETGMPGISTARSILMSDIAQMIPGYKTSGYSSVLGRDMYSHEQAEINSAISSFVAQAVADMSKEKQRSRFSAEEMLQMAQAGRQAMIDQGYLQEPKLDEEGNVITTPQFEFTGTPDEIFKAYQAQISTLDEAGREAAFAAATAAAQAHFEKNELPDKVQEMLEAFQFRLKNI